MAPLIIPPLLILLLVDAPAYATAADAATPAAGRSRQPSAVACMCCDAAAAWKSTIICCKYYLKEELYAYISSRVFGYTEIPFIRVHLPLDPWRSRRDPIFGPFFLFLLLFPAHVHKDAEFLCCRPNRAWAASPNSSGRTAASAVSFGLYSNNANAKGRSKAPYHAAVGHCMEGQGLSPSC